MKKLFSLNIKLITLAALPALLVAAWVWQDFNAWRAGAISAQLNPTTNVSQQDASAELISGKPVRVVVASQNIDLTVADGSYDPRSGEWTLSQDKAHFALISTPANNRNGNTFIYGHNTPQVFKRLADVKAGEEAQVITDNGYKFTYKYRTSINVKPRDTAVFAYQGPSILTLQTCSGLWDETRQLLTFDFVKVDKL